MKIRIARTDDAESISTIYAPYVKNTAVTFEYEAPSPDEIARRMTTTLARYPYLVADDADEVIGYTYAGTFKARPAYDWAVETSIYLRQDRKGEGVGRALYEALEYALRTQGIVNLNACVAYCEQPDEYLSPSSALFHERMGFRTIGRFHQCGYKFNRWYDISWMEKLIGPHLADQPAPKTFEEIRPIISRSGIICDEEAPWAPDRAS